MLEPAKAPLKQRKLWHPAARNPEQAIRRCATLMRRLRYRGDQYNADIAEMELLPFLVELEKLQAFTRALHCAGDGTDHPLNPPL